jgi:hypothetical protein
MLRKIPAIAMRRATPGHCVGPESSREGLRTLTSAGRCSFPASSPAATRATPTQSRRSRTERDKFREKADKTQGDLLKLTAAAGCDGLSRCGVASWGHAHPLNSAADPPCGQQRGAARQGLEHPAAAIASAAGRPTPDIDFVADSS